MNDLAGNEDCKHDKCIFYSKVALITIALVIAVYFIAVPSHAETNTTNGSYMIVTEENSTVTIIPTATPNISATQTKVIPRRIEQGGCVVPGETIDIAGIGWYSGLITYYGRYYDAYGAGGAVEVINTYTIDAWKLDNFYLDPAFFSSHLGWWYSYDASTLANNVESHGYDRMFKVVDSCVITPRENATAVQEAINESKVLAGIRANLSKLQVKTEPGIDYIISKNEETSYSSPPFSRMWVFGRTNDDTYYDVPVPEYNITTFTKAMTNSLPAGEYDVVFVLPGTNTIVEERYDRGLKEITSPFKLVKNVSIAGYLPQLAKDKLLKIIAGSEDDQYKVWKVAFQDPSVRIEKLTQSPLPNNQTYIVISGYTNANQGDTVTLVLDGTLNKVSWKTTVVNNGGGVAYRAWNATAIFDFNGVSPGQHSLTATTSTGGSATAPFYIREELPGHFTPPETIRYIDNSPFIAPIYINTTITIPVPGPTRIVTQIITPSPEQIHSEAETVATTWGIEVALIIIVCLVAFGFTNWMVSIYRRSKL